MRYLILPLLLCAACSSCSTPDENAIFSAERAVQNQLKDPDTAKFSGAFVVRGATNKDGFQPLATCGYVDGKNSFGAFTGGSRFVVDQSENQKIDVFDTISVTIEDPTKRDATVGSMDTDRKATVFEEVYWNTSCVDATHPPSYTGEHY